MNADSIGAQWQEQRDALEAAAKAGGGVRGIAAADGRIVGPDGKLYAHVTTTCLVFDTKL